MINTILGILGIVALIAFIVFLVIITIAAYRFLKVGVMIKDVTPENTTEFVQEEFPKNSGTVTQPILNSNAAKDTEDFEGAQKTFEDNYKKLYEDAGMDAVIKQANAVMGIKTVEDEEGK